MPCRRLVLRALIGHRIGSLTCTVHALEQQQQPLSVRRTPSIPLHRCPWQRLRAPGVLRTYTRAPRCGRVARALVSPAASIVFCFAIHPPQPHASRALDPLVLWSSAAETRLWLSVVLVSSSRHATPVPFGRRCLSRAVMSIRFRCHLRHSLPNDSFSLPTLPYPSPLSSDPS